MDHKTSSVRVYSTSDYSRFRMIEGNRQLNEKKINKIIEDIQSGIDVLKYYPINVYENRGVLDIDDGQHRFYIARKLRRPVHYILMERTLDLSEIAKVNSNVEKWNERDFINCYVQLGDENYVQLQQFMDRFGLSVSLSVQLLKNGTPELSGNKDIEGFQRGFFKVGYLSEASDLAKIATEFNGFKGWKSRYFFVALYKILHAKKIKMKDLADKSKKNIEKLTREDSYKKYIEQLESIYNTGRKDRVIIYE